MENTDTVTLTCNEDTNDGVTSYEWYFKGARKVGQTAKTLQIGSQRSASGNYECKVVTGSGISEKSITKSVTFLCEYYSTILK